MSVTATERVDAIADLSRRLSRHHTRRAIPWDALDPSTHPEDALRRAGEAWAWRAKQEHLAVAAFAEVTRAVAVLGCDPVVLGLLARAAADEVRHAALCAEWARRLLQDPEVVGSRFAGAPTIPAHEDVDLATRALRHVVEMCCFSETLTTVYFTEMRTRVTHPTAKALVETLLEDEVDHGRVGWAYLEQRRRDGTIGGLEPELEAIAQRTVGVVVDRSLATPEPSDAAVEGLGHLGLEVSAALYLDALDEVIVPGLERAGVDASRVRTKSAEWRAALPS